MRSNIPIIKIKLYIIEKRVLFFLLLHVALLVKPTYAQVTIGSGLDKEPVAGALLQIKENAGTSNNSTRGLSMPRVNLTSKTNLYPMFETTPGSAVANSSYNTPALKAEEDAKHTGLMVYHTEQCTLSGAGLYVWSGTEWQKIGEDTNSLAWMAKTLGTSQDQIAPNGVAWHKDHEGNIFFSMNYDVANPTGSSNRWMITNLATKTYPPRTGGTAWTAPELTNTYAAYMFICTTAYWGYPNPEGTTTASLSTTYYERQRLGLLYNYAAASGNQNPYVTDQGGTVHAGVQGICPSGWHLPTDLEWTQLETAITANASKYSSLPDGTASSGFAMMDICEATVGENSSNTILNGGFSALLAGYAFDSRSLEMGHYGCFWSSSYNGYSNGCGAYFRLVISGGYRLTRTENSGGNLFSVRCKKDE